MYIEGVAIKGRVARCVVDIHRGEDAQSVEMLDSGLLRPCRKAFSFGVLDGAAPQSRLERDFIAGEEEGVTSAIESAGEIALFVIANRDVDVSHIPRTLSSGRTLRYRAHL